MRRTWLWEGTVDSPRTPGIASLSEDNLRPAPDVGKDNYEVPMEAGFARLAIDELINTFAARQPGKMEFERYEQRSRPLFRFRRGRRDHA